MFYKQRDVYWQRCYRLRARAFGKTGAHDATASSVVQIIFMLRTPCNS